MKPKYFIRTVGDNHDSFEEATQRAISKEDYEEAAVSNLSSCLFGINIDNLAVSVVYRGSCEKYFKHDIASQVSKDGRRFKDTTPIGIFLRALMKTQPGDEAWINLSKVDVLFAVIHKTSKADSERLDFVRMLLTAQGIRFFEREHEEIHEGIAKKEIDTLVEEQYGQT